ncbi:DUF6541 family protein [Georgenia yuyongxinii]|uniref:Uncharacterized protein n=1 Tax=Georgenia yuyongxinii TaxID=2589797 RepID=A0A552WYC0_9MICO|nr:DUF6541 family protein [Georgenia yuyongxinii]TRW47666.1 hypothetical protein FJ693_00775 [Georgenia yuyongxinii]
MSWIDALPTATVLLALLYLPGWVGLRLLGVRGVLAVAGAPAAVVAVLALGAVVLDVVGAAWTPATVVLLLAVVLGLCALLGRVLPPGTVSLPPLTPRSWALVGIGLAVGAGVQAGAYLNGMGRPDAVQQIYDPVFHLNAAETVLRTGNASSLGGLDPMYGSSTGVFYPAVWHSMVALGARLSSVVVASNTLMLLTGLVVWLVGIVALARAVAPRDGAVAAVAPVVASSFLIFPANLLVLQGMFPYCLAIALTPGAVALVVGAVERSRAGEPLEHAIPTVRGERPLASTVRGALAAVVACAGVVAAQPAGLAVLGLFVLPYLGQVGARRGLRQWRLGHRATAVVAAGAAPAVALALVVAVYTVPALQAMAAFPAAEGSRRLALFRGLTFSTTIGWTSPWANVVVAALVLIGVVVAAVTVRTRWLAVSWLLTLGIYVVAAGPNNVLRDLAGFWYKSADRTFAMLPTVAAVLGAMGVVALGRAAQRLLAESRAGARHGRTRDWLAPLVMVGVLVLAFVTSGAFRYDERQNGWTAWGFQPDRILTTAHASTEELTMIRSLDDVLPDDAVVLGDPRNGAALVQSVGGAVAFIPHVNPSSWDADQSYLKAHFGQLRSDPKVCEIVAADHIDYFYADDSGPEAWEEASPGLYDVDTSTGFELLAEGGPARVYRITACG